MSSLLLPVLVLEVQVLVVQAGAPLDQQQVWGPLGMRFEAFFCLVGD